MLTMENFLLNVAASLVAAALVGGATFYFFRGSLFSRLNKATTAEVLTASHKESLLGARSILEDCRVTIRRELFNKTSDITICDWFDKEMDQFAKQLDRCVDEAEAIKTGITVLKNIGDDIS